MPSHWVMTQFPCFRSICALVWKLKRHTEACKKELPECSMKQSCYTASSLFSWQAPGDGNFSICSSQGSPEEKCSGKKQSRAAVSSSASSRGRQGFVCWEEGHKGYVLLMQLKRLSKNHSSSNVSQVGQQKKAGCHCIILRASGACCFPEFGLFWGQHCQFSLLCACHLFGLENVLHLVGILHANLEETLSLLR